MKQKNQSKSSQQDLLEELKQLRSENKLLKQERDILKKGNSILCQRNSLKYAWIKKHKESFSIKLMCKVFKVDKSSYYHWIKNGSIIQKN